MNKREQIFIAQPRPYSRYPRLGLDPPSYGWRHLAYALLACAIVSGLIWLRLR